MACIFFLQNTTKGRSNKFMYRDRHTVSGPTHNQLTLNTAILLQFGGCNI